MTVSRPVIFISAVSKELHSTRDLVAKTLIAMGYEPKWQDIAPTETGDIRAVLRKWVDQSHAVLQIVGHRYGYAPKEPDPDFGRVSYTQYEALYALTKGKKVWYILLDEHYPIDCPDDEPADLKQLQADYRLQVKAHHGLYHKSDTTLTTENIVLRLRDDLAHLRRRGRQWAALILSLLLLLAAGVTWNAYTQNHAGETLTVMAQQQTGHTEELKLLRQGQADMRQMLESSIKGGSEEKLRQDYDAALRFIASHRGLSMTALKTWLEQNATLAVNDPELSLKGKILAMQEAGQFVEARDFAIANADRLAAERQDSKREEIELRIEASQSEITLGHYPAALEQAAKALEIADQKEDFATWGKAKHQMGRAMSVTGASNLALKLFEELVSLRGQSLGKEHPDTLKSRINFASLLNSNGRSRESEKEHRSLIFACERVLGPEHPDTLKSRNNLANALDAQGKYAEAKAEHRARIAIEERVLGPEHPDTLSSRNNLAIALRNQGNHAQAEAEHRAVLAIRERILGPEHPSTLSSRNNLASALYAQGKHAEAEAENRAVLTLRQRVLGPEHPGTLTSRNNLANALYSQGKYAEVEEECRTVLAIRERVLGLEHPDVFMSCYNLSLTLENLGRKAEALDYARRALAGWTKVLGADHPDSLDAKQRVADLEQK